MNPVIPVQMPQEQADSIRETAEELDLTQQDVIRQTLKMFLSQFRERMNPHPKMPRQISGWDALRGGRGIELDIQPILSEKVKKVIL